MQSKKTSVAIANYSVILRDTTLVVRKSTTS